MNDTLTILLLIVFNNIYRNLAYILQSIEITEFPISGGDLPRSRKSASIKPEKNGITGIFKKFFVNEASSRIGQTTLRPLIHTIKSKRLRTH